MCMLVATKPPNFLEAIEGLNILFIVLKSEAVKEIYILT